MAELRPFTKRDLAKVPQFAKLFDFKDPVVNRSQGKWLVVQPSNGDVVKITFFDDINEVLVSDPTESLAIGEIDTDLLRQLLSDMPEIDDEAAKPFYSKFATRMFDAIGLSKDEVA